MKKFILFACSFCMAATLHAHPGIGIVKDSKGNIYYTDLSQVWKINSDGSKIIVVPHVHTHELYMDEHDNLFGEHIWYNGEKLNTWGNYAWCLRSNGVLDTVVQPNEGFPENYSFSRDRLGNQYWAERWKVSRIKKKSKDGTITTLVEGKFKDIRWMHATADGIVYFVDLLDLYMVNRKGELVLLVKQLAHTPSRVSLASAKHSIFGIWTDNKGAVYAAVSSERTVKKITPDGQVTLAVDSYTPWSPSGGVFDEQGNLWLLEFNMINETRVRKIMSRELGHTPSRIKAIAVNHIMPFTIIGSLLMLSALGIKNLFSSRKKSRRIYDNF